MGWYSWWKEWTDGLERIGFLVGCVMPILMYVWIIGVGLLVAVLSVQVLGVLISLIHRFLDKIIT
jgi:hypothetical protein